jgi:superfamily II DNA/RNA helicase
MGIHPLIQKGLLDINIREGTQRHQDIIDAITLRSPVCVQSPTNSLDITLLPILHVVAQSELNEHAKKVVILCTHSNQAIEVEQWLWATGYHAKIRCSRVTQREEKEQHRSALQSNPSVIIADPGCLLDLESEQAWSFDDLDILLVLDGSQLDRYKLFNKVKKIVKSIPRESTLCVQTMEYNASFEQLLAIMPPRTRCIGFEETASNVSPAYALNRRIIQEYYDVPDRMKISTIMNHLENSKSQHVMVHTYSKRTTQRLFKIIRKKRWGVISLDQDLEDSTIQDRLKNYYSNDYRVILVGGLANDSLALRGIDEVIYYDIPDDLYDYVSSMQRIDYGYPKKIVSLLYEADKESFLNVCSSLGLEPKKAEIPERVVHTTKNKTNIKEEKVSVKLKKKQANLNVSKPKKKGKKPVEKKETYKAVEIPRVDLNKLDAKRSKSEDSDSSSNPVKRLFKRLF